MSNKVFGSAPKSQETETGAKAQPQVSSSCVQVRLNMSTKKLKVVKDVKANGWQHVSNVASGVVSYNHNTGKVLVSFNLFTEDGNNPIPVWGFEPVIEKAVVLPNVNLDSFSQEELIKAGVASIVGWEKIPLNWEGLEGLQQVLTGAPGLRASFSVELGGSIVGQLQAVEWSGVSISLLLDLSTARSGKISNFKTRFYRAVEVECLEAWVEKSIPMGVPVKGITQALEVAKAISLEGEDEEEDIFFLETQYLAAFGQVGEIRGKSKAWKTHAEMLGSDNPLVVTLAVFCLGQLLKKGALKPGNAAQLEQKYGVEITPVEGLPPTAPVSDSASSTVTVDAAEVINFDGIEL